jgi:hypothetical protein
VWNGVPSAISWRYLEWLPAASFMPFVSGTAVLNGKHIFTHAINIYKSVAMLHMIQYAVYGIGAFTRTRSEVKSHPPHRPPK